MMHSEDENVRRYSALASSSFLSALCTLGISNAKIATLVQGVYTDFDDLEDAGADTAG